MLHPSQRACLHQQKRVRSHSVPPFPDLFFNPKKEGRNSPPSLSMALTNR